MNDLTNATLTHDDAAHRAQPKVIPVPPSERDATTAAEEPVAIRDIDADLPPPPSGSFGAGDAPINIPALIAVGVLFAAMYATTFAQVFDSALEHRSCRTARMADYSDCRGRHMDDARQTQTHSGGVAPRRTLGDGTRLFVPPV